VVDCDGKMQLLGVERRDLYEYVSMKVTEFHQPDHTAIRAKT
jgi:hypothetical protein